MVLLSAGIGATPVLAMLHALAADGSDRQVLWLHAARDRRHHPFAAEVRRLMPALTHGRSYICYSQPDSHDKLGEDFDAAGRLSRSVLDKVGVPRGCGCLPLRAVRLHGGHERGARSLGVAPGRINVELFSGGQSMTPGVVRGATRVPHPPKDDVDTGPLVSFARSGIAAHWNPSAYGSLLELAEACDVPVRWSCRAGVCHNCECGLVSGEVVYGPEPLDKPADGNLLICCSQPVGDIAIDL